MQGRQRSSLNAVGRWTLCLTHLTHTHPHAPEHRRAPLPPTHQSLPPPNPAPPTATPHAGLHAEALPLLRTVVEQETEALGRDHPSTLATLNNLGVCLTEQGGRSRWCPRRSACRAP